MCTSRRRKSNMYKSGRGNNQYSGPKMPAIFGKNKEVEEEVRV